ncbi:Homeodomain-like protein, partial [Ochromonadaceae sp. CCMP2298]
GRWTREEHLTFIKGLEMHGKGWKKIASLIKTRTVVQIRTHAQKYFLKLSK